MRWLAQTSTTADAIKWAEKCPPNDVKKRNLVEDWLQEIVEDWLDKKEWTHIW